MYDYIRGNLTQISTSKVTLEVQGIGYLLFIPLNHFGKLPPLGQELLLYISTIIREDSQKSYGFFTIPERDLFEKLNDISGIGPKTALALVGHMELIDFHLAISQGNTSLISKVPGIGKKTAERLIIEMRDKIKQLEQLSIEISSKASSQTKNMITDAISALTHLGYAPAMAQKAIKQALTKTTDGEPSLSELITLGLRHI